LLFEADRGYIESRFLLGESKYACAARSGKIKYIGRIEYQRRFCGMSIKDLSQVL
jgi:hypothetical protein